MKSKVLIGSIILLALIVRFWGIDFGLPHKHILDEEAIVYRAFFAGVNSLQPLRYIYAPFVPYLVLFEYGIFFAFGKIFGLFANTSDFFVSYLKDPTVFFLIARVTTALAGIATVWLLWLIGKKFFSKRVGLIASFFLALTFLHVKESHYIKEDVIAGLFVFAVFYFALNILKADKLKDYILAGVMFGIALGAKYQSALILPVLLLAIFKTNKYKFKKLAYFVASSFLTYSVTNPYLIIEPRGTIQGIIQESALGRVFYPYHLQGKPVWWWFITEHIPQGLGWPLFLVGVFGFIVCLRIWMKDKRKKHYLLIPVFPIIFFISLDFWTKVHFARYAIPTMPFFALGTAVLLVSLSGLIKNKNIRNYFLIVSSIGLIAPSFLRVVKFNRLITASDTREQSLEWAVQNIEEGTKVLVEATVRPEYHSNLSVPLSLSPSATDKRVADAQVRGQEGLYLKSLRQANLGEPGYDIVATPRVDMKLDIFESKTEPIESASFYEDLGVEYLVLSSWAIRPDPNSVFFDSISDYYVLIAEFKPTYNFPGDPHLIRVDYSVLDSVDPFRQDLTFGPVISIYRIR